VDITLLIDAIVRQTTILIAQLATASGGRPLLAHTANQVFLDLVRSLKEQGLGNKVIADMFGMALRTYHSKVRRLAESSTFRGKSLWSAALEYIQSHETVLQTAVLKRFRQDDEASVRGVLADLVDSGIVFKTGRGAHTTYRAGKAEEYRLAEPDQQEIAANLLWVAVSRFGPAEASALSEVIPLAPDALSSLLERLVTEGRVMRSEQGGRVEYSTELCLIPFGVSTGWEAAVFDHYQALVTAVCAKLQLGSRQAAADDRVGGSTYGFVVWEGHPLEQEVFGLLSQLRAAAAGLRQRVTDYNRDHSAAENRETRVIAYVGQTVLEEGSQE
jgi:hypothetical protein